MLANPMVEMPFVSLGLLISSRDFQAIALSQMQAPDCFNAKCDWKRASTLLLELRKPIAQDVVLGMFQTFQEEIS